MPFPVGTLDSSDPPPHQLVVEYCRGSNKRHLPNKIIVPVKIVLAVDVAIFDEAGHLWVQRQFALAALQTRGVPLTIYRDQVVPVGDPPSAAVANRSLCAGARAGRCRPHGFSVLQHPAVTISAPGRNLFSCKIRAFYSTESYVTVLWDYDAVKFGCYQRNRLNLTTTIQHILLQRWYHLPNCTASQLTAHHQWLPPNFKCSVSLYVYSIMTVILCSDWGNHKEICQKNLFFGVAPEILTPLCPEKNVLSLNANSLGNKQRLFQCIVEECRLNSYNKNQRDALISQIYFWNTTLYVSDRFSVHRQESSTVYTAIGNMSYRLRCLLTSFHPDPASKQSV